MVVVAVKNTYSVAPADPTPVGRLALSEFDQPRHWTLTPLLYVYKPNKSISTSSLIIDTITNSLSRALVPFYPLAGRLRWIGGGRLELHCNAAGAELAVAESTSRLDELTDFEPSAQIENLLPKFDYTSPIHTMPVVSVTITTFACGGFTLGIAISHAVVDGGSFTRFVSAWAKLARGEALESRETPSHDRFKIGDAHAPPRFDHVEYKPLPLLIGRSDSREEEAKETIISMLKLTKSQVDQLKKRANSDIENRPYSTYETVTAHIWRCACKARNGQIGQPTVIRVIVDCRRRLKPLLPENYCGNAILFTITDPTCLMSDLVDNPLSYAAGKIREAIGSFTYEYIISALNLIASQEDVSRLIREPEGSSNGRQFLGNPNLLVTSWINVPIYDADFSWGRPVYVRPGPGAMDTDGKAFIIPSSNGDGSLVVVLRLQTQHMAGFKKWFYQDIESISTCKL